MKLLAKLPDVKTNQSCLDLDSIFPHGEVHFLLLVLLRLLRDLERERSPGLVLFFLIKSISSRYILWAVE